jgi:hypothetical protein
MTEHVRNYILPARSQCWDVCLSPIINTPSSSAVQVSQALVEGLDFEVVSIITTFDPSAPSFALPHDRRQILDWTNKQRRWAEQGEEVDDIEDLQLKVGDTL